MMRAILLACALVLPGCMARFQLSPQAPVASTASQPAGAKPRLWYVGLGLYDETWSEADVAAAASELARHAQGFQLVPLVFSNGAGHGYAPPNRANVDATMAEIAQRARPDDIVLLYLSTHGAPGLLAREANGRDLAPATADEMREWLAPLGRRPTVLILSACFSASFIPSLRAENRIIFTAARADRTSFGCRAGAEHTVFGAALLDALATPQTSLRAVVQTVRAKVAAREHELGVTPPSEPQVSVGPSVAGLYEAPVF